MLIRLVVMGWLVAGTVDAGNVISVPVVTVDRPSFSGIGLVVHYGDDDNRNASVTCRYREVGAAVWRSAQPLRRVPVERVTWKTLPRQFAGPVFDLRPNRQYEVEITVQDPDGYSQVITMLARTRGLLAGAATPRQVRVTTVAELSAAVAGALPGDVITIAPGSYVLEYLEVSKGGTAENPVIIRGEDRERTVLDGGGCRCNIVEVYTSHVRVENLTFRNAQQAIRYFSASEGIVFRRNRVTDVDRGINTQPDQMGFVIADNVFEGRVAFSRPFPPGDDTYGMQIHGSDHIIAHNEIRGFMDGIRLFGGENRNVEIYGNDIVHGSDDGIEADGSERNVRVMRNRISNVDSGISAQPSVGGPLYLVRNVIVNVRNEQFKLHGTGGGQAPSGVYAFHNTTLSPVGALQMYSAQIVTESMFRNNIFFGPGTAAGPVIAWDGPLFNVSWNYDGYFPEGRSYWNYQGNYQHYGGLAALFSGGLFEANGRALPGDTFLTGLNGGASLNQYVAPQLPRLRGGRSAIGAGQRLENINDNVAGAAPDLGALESGCAPPHYGPRAADVNEATQVFGCPEIPAPANLVPQTVAVTNAGGSGASRQLLARVKDANGFADIEFVTVVAGPTAVVGEGCAAVLRRSTDELFLWNDGGTGLLGPVRPGGSGKLENGRCSLVAAGSKVVTISESNSLELVVDLTFKASLAGAQNLYLQVTDQSGGTSGMTPMGAFPPVAAGVVPGAGTGAAQVFRFTFNDPGGWEALGVLNILINRAIDGRGACYVAFVSSAPGAGALYLVDDAGNAGGPFAGMTLPGVQTIQNSQCSISGAGSSVSMSGNQVTLTLAVAFKSSFAGNHVIYTAARNVAGFNSGWQGLGTWSVPGGAVAGPGVGAVSPARSTQSTLNLQVTFTHSAGWANLSVVNLLIMDAIDGRGACYLAYVPATATAGTLYLVNDAGEPASNLAAIAVPGTGTASNSQCAVAGAGSSAVGAGQGLTVTVPLTLKPGFAGNRIIYAAARAGEQSSGWQAVGSVTVPAN